MPGYNTDFVAAESPKAVVLPFGGGSTLEESIGQTLVEIFDAREENLRESEGRLE